MIEPEPPPNEIVAALDRIAELLERIEAKLFPQPKKCVHRFGADGRCVYCMDHAF